MDHLCWIVRSSACVLHFGNGSLEIVSILSTLAAIGPQRSCLIISCLFWQRQCVPNPDGIHGSWKKGNMCVGSQMCLRLLASVDYHKFRPVKFFVVFLFICLLFVLLWPVLKQWSTLQQWVRCLMLRWELISEAVLPNCAFYAVTVPTFCLQGAHRSTLLPISFRYPSPKPETLNPNP